MGARGIKHDTSGCGRPIVKEHLCILLRCLRAAIGSEVIPYQPLEVAVRCGPVTGTNLVVRQSRQRVLKAR